MNQITAFWDQISPRERILLGCLVLAAFLFVNAWLLLQFNKRRVDLLSQIEDRQNILRESEDRLAEKPMLESRNQWLTTQKRPLDNPDRAAQELLDRLTQLADSTKVLPSNPPVIKPSSSHPSHRAVSVELDTNSSWPDLVRFLYEVQNPSEAIAFDSLELSTDPKDKTKVRGKFTVSRYFSP
jgi:hypothetical protein